MTHDEALALYNAGAKVVAKILCDLSNTIESQQEKINLLLPMTLQSPSPTRRTRRVSAKLVGNLGTRDMSVLYFLKKRLTSFMPTY